MSNASDSAKSVTTDEIVWSDDPFERRRISFRMPSFARWRRHVAAGLIAASLLAVTPAIAQEDIESAKTQRDDIRREELKAKAALDVLDAEWEEIQAAYQAADALVLIVETREETLARQLELAQQRLIVSEVGIAWAEFDQSSLDEELARIAIRQYLGNSDSQSIWEGHDPNETLRRNAVLEAVQRAGNDIIDTAQDAQHDFVAMRAQVEEDIAEVERLEADLQREREALQDALDARKRAVEALEARLDSWSAIIDDLEDEDQRLTEFIRVETAKEKAEEERQRQEAALSDEKSREGYQWPTAGGIGSYFGMRMHPVLGYKRLHGGIDIGGRMGQDIVASKAGKVILAGVQGGYGNCVVIDHGNGYSSLYAHMSLIRVSKGDRVKGGDLIGDVGSTGLSTGPHLHFEVRVNGKVTDPLPFLPPR